LKDKLKDMNEETLEWTELPNGGIADDGALIINYIPPKTPEYITIIFPVTGIYKDLTS
jgi:hypothetical protein